MSISKQLAAQQEQADLAAEAVPEPGGKLSQSDLD